LTGYTVSPSQGGAGGGWKLTQIAELSPPPQPSTYKREGDPLRHSLAHPWGAKVKVSIFLEI